MMKALSDFSARDFLEIADHTLLDAAADRATYEGFVRDAARLGAKRICVPPSVLPLAAPGLEIVSVVGFPTGAHHARVKAAEAEQALADGADEIDMVVNRSLVTGGEWTCVEREIAAVRAVVPEPKKLKVIIESATLTDAQIISCARVAEAGGADFVKTSTGFHPSGGATVHAVQLIAATVGPRLGVKASGGVRTPDDVRALRDAGATRFGVSATATIVKAWETGAAELSRDDGAY